LRCIDDRRPVEQRLVHAARCTDAVIDAAIDIVIDTISAA